MTTERTPRTPRPAPRPTGEWRATRLAVLVGLSVGLSALAVAGDGEGDPKTLDWSTIDGGGGDASGGDFAMRVTIGQPDAGPPLTGADWSLAGGFWAGDAVAAPPCPADLDGSGSVDFSDLLSILAGWGVCPGCPEDLNGNGAVDFSDLLVVLSAWGDCP